MKKYVLVLSVIALLSGGCAHWQTPYVTFDFGEMYQFDERGAVLSSPTRIIVPMPKFQNSLSGEMENTYESP